jgi:hypothetical protein
MSDLLRTLAFAYRRKGAQTLVGTELRYLLAFDLRWFAPEDAKKVVLRAIDLGLLVEEGDGLRPAFDTTSVDIPINFRPTSLVLDEDAPTKLPSRAPPSPAVPQTPTPPIVPILQGQATEFERAADDERRKRGLLVSPEVARLVVRRRMGDDVTHDAATLEAALLGAAAPLHP